MLRLAGKALAQFRVLRGDADRAGVQVTLAHHDAAFNDQGCGGKAELVGTEQGTDNHITTGTHAAINLHGYAAAQVVQHQGLVGLCKADFPRRSGMLYGCQRTGTGTTVKTRNGDMVGMCLGDTGGNRTHTHLGHQFDADVGQRVGVLKVMNQLRQVLDGIDVMMRRR